MSARLVMRTRARTDFLEAFEWYESQREGLGVEFSDQVQAVFDSIAANPEAHPEVYRDLRKALVRPFPYSVV